MSEKSVVENAVNEDQLSEDELKEKIVNVQDLDELEKLEEQIKNGQSQVDVHAEEDNASQNDDSQEEYDKEKESLENDNEEAKYSISLKDGRKIDFDDNDGMLGYGSIDNFKKSFAHKLKHIKDVESENKNYREQFGQLENQKKELEEKIKSLEEVKVASSKPKEEPQEQVPEKFERPTPPTIDPMDDDSVKEWNEYQIKLSEYLDQMNAVKSQPDNSAIEKLREEYEDKIKAIEGKVNTIQQKENQELQKIEEDKYWLSLDKFQENHPELKTKKPLKDMIDDVSNFMDDLALASGEKRPTTPKEQEYFLNNARLNITQRYLDGDPDIVKIAQGLQVPDDLDKYFETGSIKKLSDSHNLSLDDALVLYYKQTGKLDQLTEKAVITAREQGRKDIGDAVKEANQYVPDIPNDVGQTTNASGNMDVTAETLANASIDEIARNPEMMALLNKLTGG